MILTNYNDTKAFCESLKSSGKRIVSTNGCFDVIHKGHVSYLTEAKKLGDVLIVGLNSDASVKRLKGESRPINDQESRAYVMEALKPVDHVVIFDEDTPVELLRHILPDFHVKGGDYSGELPESAVVEDGGGKMVFVNFVDGVSSTNIINKIKEG